MANRLHVMLTILKEKLYQTPVWHKFFKSRTERDHWLRTVYRITKWYEGRQPYVFPYPDPAIKETRFDPRTNAILTYIAVETADASYLRDLQLRSESFKGMKVADIGSGPLPTLLVFEDCDRYCIDHLLDTYREIGYPIEHFESLIRFINAKSESIPLPDRYFDVIISRNALDHVDDFEATAREIKRLLKPEGYLHILVNYHTPTSSEPLVLNDERIEANFGGMRMRKLAEAEDAWGFKGGRTVLWSNLPADRLAGSPEAFSGVEGEKERLAVPA
jgi:SAM-dependent methyltransferase